MATPRKHLTPETLTGHKCMAPGCRERAVAVKNSIDRRGRLHTRTLCASCAAGASGARYQGWRSKVRKEKSTC